MYVYIDFKNVQLYNNNMRKKQLIIDASCIMAVIKQEESAKEVMEKSNGHELLSAECLPYEVGNSLSKCLKRGLMTVDAAIHCYELFKVLPVTLIEVDFKNSLSLSAEEHHYAYDMYYLDCAIRNRCPILSYDEGLISIAKKRGIKCL